MTTPERTLTTTEILIATPVPSAAPAIVENNGGLRLGIFGNHAQDKIVIRIMDTCRDRNVLIEQISLFSRYGEGVCIKKAVMRSV